MTTPAEREASALHAAGRTHRTDMHAGAGSPSPATPPILIYGCGRSLRRDDQVGLRVAERLADDPPPQTIIRATEAPGAELPGSLEGVDVLIIADAVAATERFPVGSWARVVHAGDDALPGDVLFHVADRQPPRSDTHTPNVNDALAVARELGTLPAEVWIYAVAGRDFTQGESLSPGVEVAIRSVVDRVRADVRAWLQRSGRVRAGSPGTAGAG